MNNGAALLPHEGSQGQGRAQYLISKPDTAIKSLEKYLLAKKGSGFQTKRVLKIFGCVPLTTKLVRFILLTPSPQKYEIYYFLTSCKVIFCLQPRLTSAFLTEASRYVGPHECFPVYDIR